MKNNLTAALLKQHQEMGRKQPTMEVIQNGGVNQSVNFATEDFYRASLVLKRASNDFKTPYYELPPGVQSFVSQQIFRMNSAGMMLDSLGYQSIVTVLITLLKDATSYVDASMKAWNDLIEKEGEVQKIWDAMVLEDEQAMHAANSTPH